MALFLTVGLIKQTPKGSGEFSISSKDIISEWWLTWTLILFNIFFSNLEIGIKPLLKNVEDIKAMSTQQTYSARLLCVDYLLNYLPPDSAPKMAN